MEDTNEVQMIIQKCFENLRSNELENQDKIDEFPHTCDPPKLNQDDIKS
jgi:hypothetical protein